MGREVLAAITDGKLDFGPWEQIFYGEFDGRCPKRVLVKIIVTGDWGLGVLLQYLQHAASILWVDPTDGGGKKGKVPEGENPAVPPFVVQQGECQETQLRRGV